ncbi:TlpA family protein disulfide reductase [Psychroflexus planctonicus]|uniref:Thioredoxin domain-containing protein n=1 Tax=Psychroflexus planctonicus TaxID=1526575 RepID=A0ABQ1SH80_9FLAO|nr:TlpA disulfide reductase family protein [Psychroflexus planctonicus]GGE31776.1 hypothetical protein GCM10010832_10130 [Psychroflexus planctonicus]
MKTEFIKLLLICILVISCQEENQTTYFSAKLPSLNNKNLELVPVNSYYTGLKRLEKFPVAKTDSTGFLSFEMENLDAGFYQLIYNNYPMLNYDIYLEPKDSIVVEQSSWQDKPSFKVTGNGAEKLHYLETDFQLFEGTNAFYKKIKSDEFHSAMDFKKFIDSIFKPRFKKLAQSKNSDTQLDIHLKKHLEIQRANFLLQHLEYRNYYMQNEFNYHFPKEEDYISFLDSVNINDDFTNAKYTLEFAQNYLTYITEKEIFENPDLEKKVENLNLKWDFISHKAPTQWNDLLALSTIKDFSFAMLEDGFFEDLSNFRKQTDSLFFDEENQKLFKLNAEPFLKLAPGEPAPDFALPDAVGKIHRLSDFKGKVVYIDFWGTWCGPCIAEIPATLALHKKYKDEDVVFLNVALESGEKEIEEWRSFISGDSPYAEKVLEGKPYTGVHLVAENQFRNEEIKDYLINFAPTYVLVDQEGNLVNARAPRPKQIEDELNLLLEKMKGYE